MKRYKEATESTKVRLVIYTTGFSKTLMFYTQVLGCL